MAHITALAVQLAFFGLATGALGLALGAGTGRRGLANGCAAAVVVFGWLVNSFAPLVGAIAWLKYVSLFYYYAGHDPLARGVGVPGLVVLGLMTLALTARRCSRSAAGTFAPSGSAAHAACAARSRSHGRAPARVRRAGRACAPESRPGPAAWR